jgi:hypothetical protein
MINNADPNTALKYFAENVTLLLKINSKEKTYWSLESTIPASKFELVVYAVQTFVPYSTLHAQHHHYKNEYILSTED